MPPEKKKEKMKVQHAKAQAKFIKNFASREKRESESAAYKVPGKI